MSSGQRCLMFAVVASLMGAIIKPSQAIAAGHGSFELCPAAGARSPSLLEGEERALEIRRDGDAFDVQRSRQLDLTLHRYTLDPRQAPDPALKMDGSTGLFLKDLGPILGIGLLILLAGVAIVVAVGHG